MREGPLVSELEAVHGDEGGPTGLSADHHEGELGEAWQLVTGSTCREKLAVPQCLNTAIILLELLQPLLLIHD